jgi:glycosyltransferase involved in cell wall biosynthesis
MKDSALSDLWVVIPAFNEGPVIADVVREVIQHCPNVILVDDGSHDDTSQHARSAGAIGRGVELIYYFWIVLSLAVFINVHLKLRENLTLVTQLARQIAIGEGQRNLSDKNASSVPNPVRGAE